MTTIGLIVDAGSTPAVSTIKKNEKKALHMLNKWVYLIYEQEKRKMPKAEKARSLKEKQRRLL
tara:strand:+ start:95 stop:283 length:189 start_codon:yes stop_codon:yes gene_type:complete